jgi:sugar lactone lactonase YvrE
MLSDSGLGQAVGAIAVDRKDDVFVAYTTGSSQISAQIDEFPDGHTTSVPFATISNADDGALAVTNKGDVVASSISLGSGGGQISVFSPKGTAVSSFAAAGLPDAISLDNSNKHLWIDDATNDAITEYAFPAGGAPLFSAPLETSEGTLLTPADFLPKDFQKP